MLHCTPSHIFTTDKVTITYIIEREREWRPTQYYSRHVELDVVVEDGWCHELFSFGWKECNEKNDVSILDRHLDLPTPREEEEEELLWEKERDDGNEIIIVCCCSRDYERRTQWVFVFHERQTEDKQRKQDAHIIILFLLEEEGQKQQFGQNERVGRDHGRE